MTQTENAGDEARMKLSGIIGKLQKIGINEVKVDNEAAIDTYLFSWDNIPGDDEGKLKIFLKDNYSIDWIKTAAIKKIDDVKVIILSFKDNFLFLKINNAETKVSLKIDDGRSAEFIAKSENGKLNI
jgi:hypothetical protein